MFLKYIAVFLIATVLGSALCAQSVGADTEGVVQQSQRTKKVSFDFENANLASIVYFVAKLEGKMVLGEALLKGKKITIKSPGKVSMVELFNNVNQILNSYGYSLEDTGSFLRIEPNRGLVTQVYKMKYLDATKVADAIRQVFVTWNVAPIPGQPPVTVRVTPMVQNNTVIVSAPRAVQKQVQSMISKLDMRTPQVLINVKILQLTTSGGFGFGLNFVNGSQRLLNGGANLMTGGSAGGIITKLANGVFSNKGSDAMDNSSPYFAFNKSLGGATNLQIYAGQGKTKAKLLASPSILTADNQKATIKVQTNTPYVSGTTTYSSGTDAPASNTTSSNATTGITLEVKPTINEDRDISLNVKFSLKDILSMVPVGTLGNQPKTSDREVDTYATVMDAHTLVIGGLLQNQKITSKYSPPILGDIPLIGWLFSTTNQSVEQTELILLITPSVVQNSQDARKVTEEQKMKTVNYDKSTSKDIKDLLNNENGKPGKIFSINDVSKDLKDQYHTLTNGGLDASRPDEKTL